jgi:two-component system sensor histidine kinase UhpB
VKYAQAKHVNAELGLTADAITLVIEDDGIGIHDDAQNNRLSHGISGMRQRVRALHGEFSIARRPKGGTVVKVRLPVAPRPAQEVVPAEVVAEPVTPPAGR